MEKFTEIYVTGGHAHGNRPAHRHPCHPSAGGEGHRGPACRPSGGKPEDHLPRHGPPVPRRHPPPVGPGPQWGHLHHGGLLHGADPADRGGPGGHPGGPAEPGQRVRHGVLPPPHGKAPPGGGRDGGRLRVHRPVLLVRPPAGPTVGNFEGRLPPARPGALHLLRPLRRQPAGGGARPAGVPVVQLVSLRLVPGTAGLAAVQAHPDAGHEGPGGNLPSPALPHPHHPGPAHLPGVPSGSYPLRPRRPVADH